METNPEMIKKAYESILKEFNDELTKKNNELDELEISRIKQEIKNEIYAKNNERDKTQKTNNEEINSKYDELKIQIGKIEHRIKILEGNKDDILKNK